MKKGRKQEEDLLDGKKNDRKFTVEAANPIIRQQDECSGGVELNPRAQTGLDLMNAAHVWAHVDRNWAVYEGDKSKT